MQLSDRLRAKSAAELEEWFLEKLDSETLPLREMSAVLSKLTEEGNRDKAGAWAELLQDALSERGDAQGALRLLRLRCGWEQDSPELRGLCAEAARAVMKDRMGQALLKNAGFDAGLPAAESVRRLIVLTNLKEGAFCHDNTWGFGVVRRLDDFYEKVTIDFTKKPGHQMSFAYAGETLQLVGEDHLLARLHTDPANMAEMVKTCPGDVVRTALRSYGPLSVPDLQGLLMPDIVGENEWKAFWEAARKQLKRDPLFDLPAKRSEPMRLLESAKEYDEQWIASLSRERDPGRIFELVGELEKAGAASGLDPDGMGVVAERCAFALSACENNRPDLAARLLLAMERLGLPAGEEEAAGVRRALECLLTAETCRNAVVGLSARELQLWLRYMAAREPGRIGETLLGILPKLTAGALETVTGFLEQTTHATAMADVLRVEFGMRETGPCLLAWAARNLDEVDKWALTDKYTLMGRIVDVLGISASGDDLKARKLLMEKLADAEWLKGILSALDTRQIQALFSRVKLARGWDEAERRSLMARFIKLFPELEAVAADSRQAVSVEGALRLTSWRSYRERREALRKLLEETIPENSREIGVARSYGDLRENFEYQAAKDRQRLLLQRKTDMERDLAEVKGSDFRNMPSDRAGMGTCVSVEHAGGVRRYCILGEWDRDEELGIISSSSKLATALEGHAVGDEVVLPGDEAPTTGRILEVTALSNQVRGWIAG